ncbi:hypothetical protein F2Q70_00016637 [Brassica cretica]|uniref:Uncharacterized protein n=1 Tax=Brassica cretica TaxID=69181 RepID=A0A8S9HZE4_BRACR|nr:hypothetical protein F2Q70_00016637 [Brassica cretica]
MADDWDLHAVVRGCSAVSSSATTVFSGAFHLTRTLCSPTKNRKNPDRDKTRNVLFLSLLLLVASLANPPAPIPLDLKEDLDGDEDLLSLSDTVVSEDFFEGLEEFAGGDSFSGNSSPASFDLSWVVNSGAAISGGI